jgi:predicted glycoside hydrolase/deacetylase ChbG (UPF0249 family)
VTVAATRLLVVNADDFGLTPGVGRGILEAHRAGIVTSTTALVNLSPQGDLDAEAVGEAGLGVGLHVNLTWGAPVSPPAQVPSLVDGDGRFRRDPEVVAAHVTVEEVRREAEAQLDVFARRFGRSPTHLDSHHHVHRQPRVMDAIMEVALAAHLPVRSQDAGFRQGLRRYGVHTTDHFLGDAGMEPYWTVERLLDALAGLAVGVTELMCHPGRFDEALAGSRYGRQREVELRALCDPEVRATVDRLGIRLGHFGDLVACGPA